MISDQKMERLSERLGFLVGHSGEGGRDRSRGLAAAFKLADPLMLANLLREFGDTARTTTLVEYLKLLEALDFEQFADFPMSPHGRTLAFVRQRGFVLAVLVIEPGRPPSLELVARSLGSDFHGHSIGFLNEVSRIKNAITVAHRVAFDGTSGLLVKLYHLDQQTTLSDAWWSLDDLRNDLPSITIGSELVKQRERYLCDDYEAVKRLIEERREAIPAAYRFQSDADHRFALADVMARRQTETAHPNRSPIRQMAARRADPPFAENRARDLPTRIDQNPMLP